MPTSPAARARFDRDGFAVIDRLADAATLELLREGYDRLLAGGSRGDRMLGGITRQIMLPEQALPVFDRNAALDAALEAARELRGFADPVRTYSMLICKPPGHPHATPWHQDIAYAGVPVFPAGRALARRTLQFWLALDDADADNGCMHFAPCTELRSLPHVVASGAPDDEGRLLAVAAGHEPGAAAVVSCPLAAGDATVHHEGTLHFTPANRSPRMRRAYIFNIADRSTLADLRRGPSRAR